MYGMPGLLGGSYGIPSYGGMPYGRPQQPQVGSMYGAQPYGGMGNMYGGRQQSQYQPPQIGGMYGGGSAGNRMPPYGSSPSYGGPPYMPPTSQPHGNTYGANQPPQTLETFTNSYNSAPNERYYQEAGIQPPTAQGSTSQVAPEQLAFLLQQNNLASQQQPQSLRQQAALANNALAAARSGGPMPGYSLSDFRMPASNQRIPGQAWSGPPANAVRGPNGGYVDPTTGEPIMVAL